MTGNRDVYLRSDVKVEPLVHGWYAWTHLVSPAQRALNFAYRYIPLLQSFVKNPAVHVAAAADPTLFGGPFVHLPQEKVREVQQLLEETEASCTQMLTLARDIRELDRHLQESATGYSLGEFYARLPQSLSGLVEFLYDINNHPRMRFFEEFLYDAVSGEDGQAILLTRAPEQDRAFFLSTPRLRSAGAMMFQTPFTDERLDLLASLRTQPGQLAEIARSFGIADEALPTFANFFTTTAPSRNQPDFAQDGVRVRYFGHACVLVQTKDVSILIDPMFAWETHESDGRFTFCDLPDRVDLLVLSHNHQDHCAPEMLLPLRHRVARVLVPPSNSGNIADPSMKLVLTQLGFTNVDIVHPFDTVSFPGGRITSLPFPGEHVDLDIHSRHGVFIEIGDRRIAFLVDSDGRDSGLYRRAARKIGRKLDALFIGMECHGAPLTWLYGPLLTKAISRRNDESRRLSGLDSQRAWNVVQEFEPSSVFVYAMGQEPWLRYIMGLAYSPDSVQLTEVRALLERCKDAGIPAENLYLSREFQL